MSKQKVLAMKYKVGQRVFTIWEHSPHGLGGLTINAYKITRVIMDKSEDLSKGDYVVFESTVYPGCTEDDCVPILEKKSGLAFNKDFKVGFSPERINPGDKEHTLTSIVKVVSGSDSESSRYQPDTCTKPVPAAAARG